MRRGHGSPPVLSEVPHELRTAAHSKERKRSPQQFIPAGFSPHDTLQSGTKTSYQGRSKVWFLFAAQPRFGRRVNRNRLVSAL